MFKPVFETVNQPVFDGIFSKENSSLLDSLVEFWKMDETSGARIGAANGYTLNDVNTVGSAAGIIGNGADFIRANNEYLQIDSGDNSNFVFANQSYSLTLWYKLSSLPTGTVYTTISRRAPTSGPRSYWVLVRDDGVGEAVNFSHYLSDNSTQATLVYNTTHSIGVWQFVCCVYDHDEQLIKLYYNDNAPISAAAASSSGDTTSQLKIGQYQTTNGFYFDGVIDEVGFWRRPLSHSEILKVFNGDLAKTYPF